jgi:5-(carboxyamino)imidazole ribonucleotide mutase
MNNPLVYIVMGSDSDWDVMQHAVAILEDFNIAYGVKIISAHRTPDLLFKFAEEARGLDVQCIIAGAGGAAHLPGMIAAKTTVPVLGVPVNSKYLQGIDSLLSIVQMPKGVPVATFAIGDAGAANAGLFAVALLAVNNSELGEQLISFRQEQTEKVLAMKLPQ